MNIITIKPIQIIVASEDEKYKKNLENYFNEYYPFVDVILLNTITEVLAYFNDKPPFKLLIRKHNKPLDKEELGNCKLVALRELNLRLIVSQQKHKKLVRDINNTTITYLKKEKHLFLNMNTTVVLSMLKHKGFRHRFFKVLAHGSSIFS